MWSVSKRSYKMRKKIIHYSIIFFLSAFVLTSYSCSKKTGCPINEKANVKPDKKGNYKKKKTKSGLFPKNMR